MNNNILDLLQDKNNSKIESSTSFNKNSLLNEIKYKETNTHLYIYDFPSAFGDTQNTNNRVYDQKSLREATLQYQEVKNENPYFCYIFDGHRDEDSYENIIGRVINLKLNDEHKCILSDIKINKGAKSYQTLSNILKDGDPIGISMRIISPETITLTKNEIINLNPNINQLHDNSTNIAQLMSNDEEIEYISGKAFIQRFDLTQFPSFNKAYVSKFNKNESINFKKFKEYKETSCLISKDDKCITDSCKYKQTIMDFIELISKDESINTIKQYPLLYDDMLRFAYMNLSNFNFDEITKINYLKEKLKDSNIDIEDNNNQITTLNELIGFDNILNFINKNNKIEINDYIKSINYTLNKILNVDNIFYQLVTINYIHQIILSNLIIQNRYNNKIHNNEEFINNLNNNIKNNENINIIINFINQINKPITLYEFTNIFFTYIYSYLNKYSSELSPSTIINESYKIFKLNKNNKIFIKNYTFNNK